MKVTTRQDKNFFFACVVLVFVFFVFLCRVALVYFYIICVSIKCYLEIYVAGINKFF
jgi:hypothetical protein